MENDKQYWLISAPKTREDTYNTLTKKIAEENDLAQHFKFNVPDLKVGTLDSLMALSDDLGKHDSYCENVTRKIAAQLYDVLESSAEKTETLTINNSNIDTYLNFFTWDEAKYPSNHALKVLTEVIHAQTVKFDEELKAKSSEYANLVHAMNAEERKAGGNLLVKDFSDAVTPEDVLSTEYMETVFVAVPRHEYKQFEAGYYRVNEFVVPGSSKLIVEDSEFGLYRVVMFRKFVTDFTNAARERKWYVREFVYDANKNAKTEKKRMEAEKDKLKKGMIRWCKTNFAEAFIGWAHLKAIRVFVESVLRFGLPINFQAILLLPKKGKQTRLRKVLGDMFAHLGSKSMFKDDEDDEHGTDKFFPYVSLQIDLNYGRSNA